MTKKENKDFDFIDISEKYIPLFDLLEAKEVVESDYFGDLSSDIQKRFKDLSEVELVIMTGGRDSAKSFNSSLMLSEAATNYNHRILYTRYTLTSAKDSIIPDFTEKLDLLNYTKFFDITNDRITGTHNKSKIVFKGIKTSSGNMTASLKSLKDFSIFVNEEAEEMPDFETWNKIDLSIRVTDVQAFSMLILNPATTSHWIYKHFFEERQVKAGFNGIKEGVLYIHTTWKDVPQQFIAPKNLKKYQRAEKVYEKLKDLDKKEFSKRTKQEKRIFEYYRDIVLGGWKSSVDGLVYEDWEYFEELPQREPDLIVYGLDFGFTNDPAAMVEVLFYGQNIYVTELLYETGLLNSDLANVIKENVGNKSVYIACDSAEPKSIAELNKQNVFAVGVEKGAGSIVSGIKRVKDYNIFVNPKSENLVHELRHYHTKQRTNSKGETKTDIVDKDNHLMDALRYAVNLYA